MKTHYFTIIFRVTVVITKNLRGPSAVEYLLSAIATGYHGSERAESNVCGAYWAPGMRDCADV